MQPDDEKLLTKEQIYEFGKIGGRNKMPPVENVVLAEFIRVTDEKLKLIIDITWEAARASTANEIFTKLDKVVWQQIEPSRLMEFYEQFCNAKDLEASLKVATAFSIIGLDAEKYEALKRQFKVD